MDAHIRTALIIAAVWLYGCDSRAVNPPAAHSVPVVSVRLGSRMQLAEPAAALIAGNRDAQREHTLYLVRGGLLLDSGTVAIATEGSQSVRFYDLRGNFMGESGRPGEGPGEFRRLRSVQRLAGDSIAVWDAGLRRVTLLRRGDSAVATLSLGDLLSSTNVNVPPRAQPLDVFVLGESFVVAHRGIAVERIEGFSRDSMYFAFASRTSSGLALVGPVLGTEYYRDRGTIAAPYGYRSFMAAVGNAFFIGDGISAGLTMYRPDGTAVRRLLLPIRRGALTATQRDSVRHEFLSTRVAPRNHAVIGRLFDEALRADSFPAFTQLIPASSGALWVRLHTRSDSVRWLIVQPHDRRANFIDLPEDQAVLDASHDHVLLLGTDDDGREQVLVQRISRPIATSP